MLRLLLSITLCSSLLAATGCTVLNQDPRDAPWDPKGGQALFDQIPAWDGAANRICGGHLTETERQREGRSPRC